MSRSIVSLGDINSETTYLAISSFSFLAILSLSVNESSIAVSTFATATIVTYALFTFIEGVPSFTGGILSPMLQTYVPELLARKWLMITVPFVIIGIMRYAQLIYEKHEGERPEKLLTSDLPLSLAVISWGIVIILIMYVA